jgi:hypothetical protein
MSMKSLNLAIAIISLIAAILVLVAAIVDLVATHRPIDIGASTSTSVEQTAKPPSFGSDN